MNSSLKFLNFSPNSSKMNAPLAESTVIGSPLAKQMQSNQKRKPISPISDNSKPRQRTNSVKIDPHVLTDAQSNGIVSRLVKYYDESNEPERNRLIYNKVGDYPLVQLKKTELKRPIVRSTSVRIAPPNKTIMNPNVRAAIMRSSSFQLNTGLPKIVSTKMRPKDDSHKIITNHEPITDTNYPVSSKSVLDALEKNCRKRINNEELTLDRSKKFCVPQTSEVVDAPSPREFIPISSVQQQSIKRNRDQISPNKVSLPSVTNDNTLNQQSKRVKTRNNALLSSLSSSHYNLVPSSPNSSMQNTSKVTAVPSVQKIVSKEVAEEKIAEPKISEVKPKEPSEQPQKKLQLFNAKPDNIMAVNRAKLKAFEGNDDDDDDEQTIRFVKPKETVLENYEVINYVEKDKLNMMLKGLSQGIKSPTKDSQPPASKDTVDSKTIQNTAVSKPAASISFTTSTTTSTISPISTPASTSSAIGIVNPSINSNTSNEKKEAPAANTGSILNLPKPTIGEGFQFGIKPAVSTSESEKSTSSTTTSSILTLTTTAASVVSPMSIAGKPVSPLAIFSTPKVDSTTVDPNKSLISFTPVKPAETTAPATLPSISLPATTQSKPAVPMFSLPSSNFKFGESTEPKNDPKPSIGCFGALAANPAPEKPAEQTNKGSGFSFTANNTSTVTSIAPTTTAPAFSFGSSIPKLPTTSPLLSSNTPQPAPILNFQAPTTTSATAPTSQFSFGSNTPSTNKSVFGITSPIASSTASSFTKPETTVASGVGFSFGATTKPAAPAFSFGGSTNQQPQPSIAPSAATTTASSGFSFGSNNLQTTTTQAAGIFSSNPATTQAFSFGSNATSTTSSAFSGFGAQANAPAMTFGQKPQTAPATTSNSGFSFGSSMSTSNPIQSTLSVQPSQPSSFSFGQPSNTENKSTGIFSRLGDKQPEAKPFSFGGSSTANAQPSVPVFGSMAAATSAPAIFGSSTPTNSVFGQSANTGNLFSSATSTANNQATSSPFGSTGTGNLFAFGSQASSTNNNNSQQQQQSGGVFGFGNSAGSTSAPISSSNNIFGSSNNNNNSGQNVSASFTFNTATGSVTSQQQPTNNPFGQSTAPPAYQFGSSGGNNSNNNVSASFTFSGPSSAPAQSAPNSGGMFNFGTSTPSVGAGAFNFQGQSQTALPQPSPVGGNLFNIGTGGNQQQRRPARVATRRYK